jgi:hypothetical protein
MFSDQFKTSMILIILGFFSGVCMSVLFIGCGGCNRSAPKTIPIKEIKQAAADSQAVYQQRKFQLDTAKFRLQTEVAKTDRVLQRVKSNVAIRKENVRKLIEPQGYPAKALVQKRDVPRPDTAFTRCDSLLREVSLFIQENDRKDSLYETQIAALDSMVDVQSRIIQNDSLAYRNLQALFHSAIGRGEAMEVENALLEKQLKRQKVKSKLVSVGLMIISGAAVHYFLKR